MRILLDECVHSGVKAAFPGHSVKTVGETGWGSAKDGTLLAYAESQFDVFVTIDKKLEQQQNLKKHKLGFVIARVPNSKLASYQPVFGALLEAAVNVKPGQVSHVLSPLMQDVR